ncbi:unnamed protein product, partial [Polarella glacialis]
LGDRETERTAVFSWQGPPPPLSTEPALDETGGAEKPADEEEDDAPGGTE